MKKNRNNRVSQLFSANKNRQVIIVKSPASITYLIGICFPYPDQSPYSVALLVHADDEKYSLVIPAEWKGILEDQNWNGKTLIYSQNDGGPKRAFLNALFEAMTAYPESNKEVALDYDCWTVKDIDVLHERYPDMVINDCSDELLKERMIKSTEEITNIQSASIIADRGLIGALNHIEGTLSSSYYTLSEFLERVRVHAIEFGANYIGHLNVSQGKSGIDWYTPVKDFSMVEAGNTVRVNYSVAVNGSWAVCNRMLFAGVPGPEDQKAYEVNQELKNYAVSLLKPGTKICDFCCEIQKKADELQIELLSDEGLGHGVGASECEMPYINAENEDPFVEGIVISLDIKTSGVKDELIHSSDIYLINANGCELLSNFCNWDNLYAITGVRANH